MNISFEKQIIEWENLMPIFERDFLFYNCYLKEDLFDLKQGQYFEYVVFNYRNSKIEFYVKDSDVTYVYRFDLIFKAKEINK